VRAREKERNRRGGERGLRLLFIFSLVTGVPRS
jgi:hypothetical protein